jgi:hypothetical protein
MRPTLSEQRDTLHEQGIDLSARVAECGNGTQYLRGHGQWLKITRDRNARQWTFARGYNNSLKAHDTARYSFVAYGWTWDDAIEMAARHINDHK